jgi:hypothetical protein
MIFLLVVLVVVVLVLVVALLAHLLDDDRRRNRHHYHRPRLEITVEPEEQVEDKILVATLASGERVELELDEYYGDFEEMLEYLVDDADSVDFIAAEDGRFLNLAHVVELKLEPATWRQPLLEPAASVD